jgi:hypothetical protein
MDIWLFDGFCFVAAGQGANVISARGCGCWFWLLVQPWVGLLVLGNIEM